MANSSGDFENHAIFALPATKNKGGAGIGPHAALHKLLFYENR
jgi:hypothetical protein